MKIPRLVLIGAKLAVICVVAAVVLGLTNAVTAPVIVENRARALAEGLAAVASGAQIPGATVGEGSPLEDAPSATAVYPITDADGSLAGAIFQLVGVGYGGDMQLLAGYYLTGEVFSVRMMENQETPGLGKKAEAPGYMDMYLGSGAGTPVPVSKTHLPRAQADAITGATITFIGVGRALADGSDLARQLDAQTTGGTP